jgi:hypothetical protein
MGFWGAAAAVAPSIIGGIGNIVAGNEAADAAKDASRDNSQTQMRMFNEANRLSAPARIAGDRMRDEQLALMGLAPTASYSQTGAPTQGGNYVAGNSDLQNAFATLSPENKRHLVTGGFDTDGDGQISADEFGRFHYQRHGQQEGRSFDAMASPSGGSEVGAYAAPGAQDAAYDRFLGGGFARSMLNTTQDDFDMIRDASGAGGTALSGQYLEALNDANRRNTNTAFTQHYNALAGGAGQATNIAQNQGGRGMQLANALSGNRNQAAQAQGSSYMNMANQFGGMLQGGMDALAYGGFGGGGSNGFTFNQNGGNRLGRVG